MKSNYIQLSEQCQKPIEKIIGGGKQILPTHNYITAQIGAGKTDTSNTQLHHRSNRRRQNRYFQHTITSPLTFLAWYKRFNIKGGVKLVLWSETSPLSDRIGIFVVLRGRQVHLVDEYNSDISVQCRQHYL